MRFASAILAAVTLLALASTAMGALGWAGDVFPCDGASYTETEDIDIYVQVWKAGCTGPAGPCADVEAYLYYKCVGDPTFTQVPMTYNVAVGNNDEYTATIPAGHGCAEVEFYVEAIDTTDDDTWLAQDQCSNDPNFILDIIEFTAQAVTVTFHMCLTQGVETSGDVCVTGGPPELTGWGSGVTMFQSCPVLSPNLYEVSVLFPAGSNPVVEYKYRKDDCATWEGGALNHSFTIDDTGSTQDLLVDGWEFNTPDCPDCPTPNEPTQWGTIKSLYK
jgi:hypothetical protein